MTGTQGAILMRYDAMREAALLDAAARLRSPGAAAVELTTINPAVLHAWEHQWIARQGQPGGWNWRDQTRRLQPTLNRFEVAIWSGPTLCGLAIGKPSRGASHLAVQLLEGSPNTGHPLRGRIAECVTVAAASYARLLGKAQIRLIRPLPGALPIYRRLGFEIAPEGAKPPYCYLEL